ncbi:MAG: hypothetical protein M3R38_01810 [Actinomycetota bacterium]|nr:hypothetical protein [Actinomycetota bacterium]
MTKKRYALDAETEKWLLDEANRTESAVPDVVARLVKKEKDRRGGGTLRQGLSALYATSTGARDITRGEG